MKNGFWIVTLLFSAVIKINASETFSKEIFDQHYIVAKINITGNNKTKGEIIKRELTFAHNDKLYQSELGEHIKKSRENLLNTSLFNFVTIDTSFIKDSVYFTIDVQERWYIWPNPILEIADRNFSIWLKEKNWNRINYGTFLSWDNFTGRKDELVLKARFGYEEQYALSYSNPYINKKKTVGIKTSYAISRQYEIAYRTDTNTLTRFKSQDGYASNSNGFSIGLTWRPLLYSRHTFTFETARKSVLDTIIALNPNYFGTSVSETNYLTLKYRFSHDKRDSKTYTLEGYLIDFSINKLGLGIENNTIDALFTSLTYIHYRPIANKFYFGTGMKGKIEFSRTIPFKLNRAIGHDEQISGYEEYVIYGKDYFLANNTFKYELVAPREDELFFPRIPQFNKYHYALYLNLSFDFGYVNDPHNLPEFNSLPNTFLYGGAIGLDWVSYYDIVFRVECAVNRMGEVGVFLHYGSPFYGW